LSLTYLLRHLPLAYSPGTHTGFVGVKFYCPGTLADGNQHIHTREKISVVTVEGICNTVGGSVF